MTEISYDPRGPQGYKSEDVPVKQSSPDSESAISELKRNEVLSFDDGLLTVKMSGHGKANGWATLAFNEKQFELDDEGYQIVEIPPSELFELRDFLNRILPANRPGDTSARSSAGTEEVERRLTDWFNALPGESLSKTHYDQMIQIVRTHYVAQPSSVLWCCHVRGPDDVHAAPDYETALKWADMVNAMNWRAGGGVKMPDPASYEECMLKAVPSLWPHSPEAHAEDLLKSIKGFAMPSTDQLTAVPIDPETPECSICGARVFDPCRTLERAKYCQLPPGISFSSPQRDTP